MTKSTQGENPEQGRYEINGERYFLIAFLAVIVMLGSAFVFGASIGDLSALMGKALGTVLGALLWAWVIALIVRAVNWLSPLVLRVPERPSISFAIPFGGAAILLGLGTIAFVLKMFIVTPSEIVPANLQGSSTVEQETSITAEPLNNNVELVDPRKGVFRVLGFVDIQPSGEAIQLWHTQDFQDSNGVGTQFSGFDEDQNVFRSYVFVLDSSANGYEPSIAEMSVEDAVRFDEVLYKRTTEWAAESQTEISEWLSSSLNEPEGFPGTKYLATAYKFEAEEGTKLVFEVRATIDDRSAYIFSVADADDEAAVAQNVAMLAMAVVVSQSRFAK